MLSVGLSGVLDQFKFERSLTFSKVCICVELNKTMLHFNIAWIGNASREKTKKFLRMLLVSSIMIRNIFMQYSVYAFVRGFAAFDA